MSIVDTRADLAAAASGVVGIVGYPYRPPAPKAGDAWPLLGSMDRDPDTGQFAALWRLVVMLPQAEQAASAWMDARLWDLVDAVSPYGFVDRMNPAVLTTGAGDQMVLEIQLRTEM